MKIFSFISALLFVGSLAYIFLTPTYGGHNDKDSYDLAFGQVSRIIDGYPAVRGMPAEKGWVGMIADLIQDKRLNLEDFEKIDFSLPGDTGFGDDPENEFFNPKGKFKAVPIPQELINQLTTVKNTRPIFNIRRSVDTLPETDLPRGTTIDYLTLIIPNMKERCVEIIDEVNGVTHDEIKMSSNNHSIVKDDTALSACVHTTDKKHRYFFTHLTHRIRLSGEDKWRP